MTNGHWKEIVTVSRKCDTSEYLRVKFSSTCFLYSIRLGKKRLKTNIWLSEANDSKKLSQYIFQKKTPPISSLPQLCLGTHGGTCVWGCSWQRLPKRVNTSAWIVTKAIPTTHTHTHTHTMNIPSHYVGWTNIFHPISFQSTVDNWLQFSKLI